MVRKNKSRNAILTKNLGEDFSVAEILVRFLLLGNRLVEISGRQTSYFAGPPRFCVRKNRRIQSVAAALTIFSVAGAGSSCRDVSSCNIFCS